MKTAAIIFTFDPTIGGRIDSEIYFLNDIFENYNDLILHIYHSGTHKSILIATKIKNLLKVDCQLIKIDDNIKKFDNYDAIFTWNLPANFYGGIINKKASLNYRICSYFTNDLNRPIFIRVPDSELKIVDYLKEVEIKLKTASASFVNSNYDELKKFNNIKIINYKNVYNLGNGSKSICDWIPNTYVDNLSLSHRYIKREEVNSIYLSDDIFFQVRECVEKYKNLNNKRVNKLGFIGCLVGYGSGQRTKRLNELFYKSEFNTPIDIVGPKANLINFENDNVTILNRTMSYDKCINFINSHIGSIFLGKGHSDITYYNKLLYDAIIAKTPILVYSKCDSKHIIFKSDEMYFNNSKELNDLYNKLQDKDFFDRVIKEQKEEILSKLPPKKIDLSFVDNVSDPSLTALNYKKSFELF